MILHLFSSFTGKWKTQGLLLNITVFIYNWIELDPEFLNESPWNLNIIFLNYIIFSLIGLGRSGPDKRAVSIDIHRKRPKEIPHTVNLFILIILISVT